MSQARILAVKVAISNLCTCFEFAGVFKYSFTWFVQKYVCVDILGKVIGGQYYTVKMLPHCQTLGQIMFVNQSN